MEDLASAEKALSEALATYNAALKRAGRTSIGTLTSRDQNVTFKFSDEGSKRVVVTYASADLGGESREYMLTDC
ncbi:hypothetical protein [Ottowia sp.]|uniref:hypothetical protein n=1 Tax=Ottowia sp. TaxID=1898956 RepID=UPI002602CE83|nr:hypothetical protein [Ottowia sp.]